ncbi:MAG TPA: hypothetical protein VKU19_40660 [Bryobacteraceae bacterium]|nr:hypothetical protein [Bryobacteraceae bacterium]
MIQRSISPRQAQSVTYSKLILWVTPRKALRFWLWVVVVLGTLSVVLMAHRWAAPIGAAGELTAAAAIIGAWLGIPELKSVKVSDYINRFCNWIFLHRGLGGTSVCLTVLLAVLFLAVLYGSIQHYYYYYLITSLHHFLEIW